ncbi:MAG: hypothetical protein OXD43_10310 [Bacteroidetes bacterium]|nr:hypothetical protein [Bacteroidota bacterium]
MAQKKAGRWYAIPCYKIDVPQIEDNGVAVGIDRNCGQVATISTEGEKEVMI